MENLLQVGVISSTHGLKGEVKVFPTTDDPKRFDQLERVFLDTGKEMKELEIERVAYFKKFVILKFKEYNNINDIEAYKGKSLMVSRDNAVKLEENEYFIADLIGVTVLNEDGKTLGRLTDVIATGANDVYTVETDEGKEILIPAIKQCILSVDIRKKVMTVHLLKGLVDE